MANSKQEEYNRLREKGLSPKEAYILLSDNPLAMYQKLTKIRDVR